MAATSYRNTVPVFFGVMTTGIAVVSVLHVQPVVGSAAIAGAALGIILLVVAFVLPLPYLLPGALFLYIGIPRTILALNDLTATITPSLVLVAVWVVRSLAPRALAVADVRPKSSARWLVLLIMAWSAVTFAFNRPGFSSFAWMLDLFLLALVLLIIPTTADVVRKAQSAFIVGSVGLAIYCLIEFALGYNFLSPVFVSLGIPNVQHWSVYRSYATLGHPLYAGMYFSIAFGLSLGRRLEGYGSRYVLVALLNLVGLLTTVSRNSIGAVAVSTAAMVIVSLLTGSRIPVVQRVFLAMLAAVGALLVVQSPVFQDRLGSDEAQGSTGARDTLSDIAFSAASHSHWLGAGPGNALLGAKPFNPAGTIIESGYLQILISIGVPGLLFFVALLVGGLVNSVRARSFSSIGALVAFAFSIAFFNVLEASRASLLICGLVLLFAWSARSEPSTQDLGIAGLIERQR